MYTSISSNPLDSVFFFLINVLHLSPKIAKFLSPFVVLSWALLLLSMAVMFVFKLVFPHVRMY